jgi:hypothetical protein
VVRYISINIINVRGLTRRFYFDKVPPLECFSGWQHYINGFKQCNEGSGRRLLYFECVAHLEIVPSKRQVNMGGSLP